MHEELLSKGRFVCAPVPLDQVMRVNRIPTGPGVTPLGDGCLCGEEECDYLSGGYPFCRPHDEHHRGPECPIDSLGRPAPPWEDAPHES